MDQLQAYFDQEALSFARDAAREKQAGNPEYLARLASVFMQHAVERLEDALRSVSRPQRAGQLVPL
jgi:hypothetical protein